MTDVSELVSEVEGLGGGSRLEDARSTNPKLRYWLPKDERAIPRDESERIFRRVRLHHYAIAEFICLRDFLECWQPPAGSWLQ
jgi:hypothetical protein